jgi:biopolymer transport protein ExbD
MARAGRGRRVASSLSEINVVPLVDVMLVLLIIFMVTAPMIQRGIEVNLPVARRAQPIEAERLEITIPSSYRQDHKVYLGTELIRSEVVQERVRQKMETAAAKDVNPRRSRSESGRTDGGHRSPESRGGRARRLCHKATGTMIAVLPKLP